ncbi:Plant transposase (Ptta/En/Spm family) [Carex littledalei]|uniref:Plant transposase (Ptta/En/Spm family) n=1 Tax=Carex littledalei TaxID=544730 RepID=A0A833VGJ3_9POAL|nr:Plant transposase (Ptta/En/Spm family) [Carex littledalei]
MAPRNSGLSRSKATKYNKRKRTTDHQVQNVDSLDGTAECDIPPSKKKGRGPGTMRYATFVIEDRPEIWPVGAREFACACEVDGRQITTAITRLALNYMPSPLRSYHVFDPTTKKNVEKAFLERFRYRHGEDVYHCRTVLDAIAGKRYAEELHNARNKCFRKYGCEIPLWKADVPHWCLDPKKWHGLCDIFNTEEWQELRRQNVKNRLARGHQAAHHGGSASTRQHVAKMGTPTLEEIYLHIHCRLENGKSPVMSQYEAAAEGMSGTTENDDTNGIVNPPPEKSPIQPLTFDMNSLQFTNDRAKKVYGLGADFIESNERGVFQALLNAQSGQEVATCQDALNQWFGKENENNRPF